MGCDRTVLLYRSSLLPLSEVFIKRQALSYRNWRPILVGRRHLHELPLDGLDVRFLAGPQPNLLTRILTRAGSSFNVALPWYVKELERENPSIFHVHFGLDAVDAWPLARALNVPMVVTLHGFDVTVSAKYWESGNGGFILRNYPSRLLRLARKPQVTFVAVSEALRSRAIDYGIPPEKILVHYIGVDTTEFTPGLTPLTEREMRVLFVGRLVEVKGVRYLIEAMSVVQKSIPEAVLVIIGEGILRRELEQLAVHFGTKVEFRGAQPSREVKKELSAARAFCFPSITTLDGITEAFGLVQLEAQASGVPVVTSAHGGRAESICDRVSGFCFPERDVATLAAILTELLQNEPMLQSMSESARSFVQKKFSMAECTRKLEATYDRIFAAWER